MPKRADIFLVQNGYFESRSRAQSAIEAGHVFADDQPVLKPSQKISSKSRIRVSQTAAPWVSRSAVKLVHAIQHFGLSFEGRRVLDLGASTGGFTQVALEFGASKVFAVDVGHGQLHPKLKDDPRVANLEGINAKDLDETVVEGLIDAIVCDASFIGLKKVLQKALGLASSETILVALIKPQFEVGPDRVGRGGIVKDETAQAEAVAAVEAWLTAEAHWAVLGVIESPIRGKEGNKEFLIAAKKKV